MIIIAKLKEKLSINIEKIRAIFNKIENVPKNDIKSKLDKYKNLNILLDDLINHIWRILYSKNRVNNEIGNIDCDKDENAKRYASKYINIVNDKLTLTNAVSDSIDELMEDLDVNTSNDIVLEKLKEFKSGLLKSVNKFNSYVKQDTKKKDIEKKDIGKKDTKNSIEYDANNNNSNNNNNNNNNNNKPDIKLATSGDIKAHITDKQKLIKKDIKVY